MVSDPEFSKNKMFFPETGAAFREYIVSIPPLQDPKFSKNKMVLQKLELRFENI